MSHPIGFFLSNAAVMLMPALPDLPACFNMVDTCWAGSRHEESATLIIYYFLENNTGIVQCIILFYFIYCTEFCLLFSRFFVSFKYSCKPLHTRLVVPSMQPLKTLHRNLPSLSHFSLLVTVLSCSCS